MANKPGAAIVLLKRIRTLVHYAIAIKWLHHDPTLGATSYRSKEFHTWTEKELAQFEARWPEGSRQRLAFALLLYTGQRGSDVYRMSYAHIDGDTIEVAQQKTGQENSDEKLIIPMHRNLRHELALAKRKHVVILATAFGQPFSLKGFGNFMSDAIKAAGLPARCKAHGLRKAAARRLAEAGCTAKQIQAITVTSRWRKSNGIPGKPIRWSSRGKRSRSRRTITDHKLANLTASLQKRAESETKSKGIFQAGAPKGNRTPVSALRGPRPNR
jgi:integrase